jgi:hypothetical protein
MGELFAGTGQGRLLIGPQVSNLPHTAANEEAGQKAGSRQ